MSCFMAAGWYGPPCFVARVAGGINRGAVCSYRDDADAFSTAKRTWACLILYIVCGCNDMDSANTTVHRLHLCQNFHPTFSFPSSICLYLLCSLFLLRPTHANHIINPTTMNATTSNVWIGSANTALLNRNKLTQQNIMGVVIHVL